MRRLFVALALVAGCNPTARPYVAPGPPPESPRAQSPPPPLPASCDEAVGVRIEAPATTDVMCGTSLATCPIGFGYWVHNCTDEPVALFRMIDRDGNAAWEFATDGTQIAPRARRSFWYPPARPLGDGSPRSPLGHHGVDVTFVRAESGDPLPVTRMTFELVDTVYEHAKADCIEAGNVWGFHGGLAGGEGCREVMPDAGHPCNDGRDCQGYCMLQREVVVSATEKRLDGVCTRFRERFGCHAVIGETTGGIVSRNTHVASLCVD